MHANGNRWYASIHPFFVIVCVVTTSPSSQSAITRSLKGNKQAFFEAWHHNTGPTGGGPTALALWGCVSKRWVTEREQRGVPVQQQCRPSLGRRIVIFTFRTSETVSPLRHFESRRGVTAWARKCTGSQTSSPRARKHTHTHTHSEGWTGSHWSDKDRCAELAKTWTCEHANKEMTNKK